MRSLSIFVSGSVLLLSVVFVVCAQQTDQPASTPRTVPELVAAMKLTDEQKAGFQAQEELRKEAQGKFKTLKGPKLTAARDSFYAQRKATLQELFSEVQWSLWNDYWNRQNKPGTPVATSKLKESSGRFHLARRNGRTTLVTPDGQAFFSLGVTHIQAIARPAAGEPNIFANHFKRDWSAVAAKVNQNLRDWGYNSSGYGTPSPLGELIPYAEGVLTAPTSMYFGAQQFSYPDVFDPAWQKKVKQTLQRKINAHKDNPNLMGIYWTDMPLWNLKRGKRSGKTNWVESIKTLPEEAPGRQRYQEFVAERGEQATDEEFLRLIARAYYQVIGEETRRLAPDSIIFGERYGPNITPSSVIEEAAPWIDAVAVQPYGNKFDAAQFDRIHRASGGKGIIICDHITRQ